MYKVKKIVSCFIFCALIFSLCACGKERKTGSTDNEVYEETIGSLEDNELFAMIDTNAPLPVLLVTSQVFDDGTGKQASIACDVYYPVDKEVKHTGTIESMGTAYPVSYDETGIYAASGHSMQRFEVDKSGALKLAEGIYEQFDENGNAAYTMEKENETKTISEEEYYDAFEKYNNAAVVSFFLWCIRRGKIILLPLNRAARQTGYTTNIIEGVNHQYRKVTKTKSVFPSDTSHPALIPSASVLLPKNSNLIPEIGCGQGPRICCRRLHWPERKNKGLTIHYLLQNFSCPQSSASYSLIFVLKAQFFRSEVCRAL